MIYSKNKTEELDISLFQNPTAEYRGVPFWSWNCKVTKELIDWQLDCFQKMGFGGVDIHPRTGLDVEYLGKEYLHLTEYAVKCCEEKGLFCWLYDDDRFPSGTAGGIVTKDVSLRGRYLLLTEAGPTLLKGYSKDQETFDNALEHGEKPYGYFIGAYEIELQDGYLTHYQFLQNSQQIEIAFKNSKKMRFAYVKLIEEERWFEHQAYIDTMNPKAVKAFIESTHEKYFALLGEKFGSSVPAIFTDEPRMAPRKKKTQKISFAESEEDIIIPYTEYFAVQMQRKYRVNVLEKLPEYIWELPNDKKSVFRYQYQDMLAECFTEAFMDQICAWCETRGIAMTGHVLGEDSVSTQAYTLGDCMRCYRKMDLPGIDVLVNYPQFITAKQATSIARQNGKEGTVSELYGVTQWDCDFKTYKLQGDWQAALGITVRIPHLSWMSMAGEAKRDWPASIFYQSPWYTEYSYIEDYFSRLNTVLTRGRACISVAVVHPVESAWLYMGPNNQCRDVLSQMDEQLEMITRWLLFGGIDFDFISESLLPEQCSHYMKNPEHEIGVGKMSYSVILVPNLRTIRSTTLQVLEEFAQDGGKIIFQGMIPEYVDAVESDRAKKLAEKCTFIPFQKKELFEELKPYRDIEIFKIDGERSKNLFYQFRKDKKCNWLFVCHVDNKKQYPSSQEHYQILIRGEYHITLYNALTGETRDCECKCGGGVTEFIWDCYGQDSLLLCLHKVEGKQAEVVNSINWQVAKGESYQTKIVLTKPNACMRQEKNMLLLDCAEYQIDDGLIYGREEILRLDNAIRRELGYALREEESEQPWFLEEKEKHKVMLFYEIESEIDTDAFLGMEQPENAKIWLNGKCIENRKVGCYVDESISVISLPKIEQGKNYLKVEVMFHQKTNLENLYLLGDFDVALYGNHAFICERKDNSSLGDITRQGMPFYTGNLDYEFCFSLDETAEYYIQVRQFAAPVLSISVDGEKKGKIAFAPHRLYLGKLSKGNHRLVIRLFGNRHNGFGYLHNANDNFTWYGPTAYRTEGDDWTDCYRVRTVGILSAIEIQKKEVRF